MLENVGLGLTPVVAVPPECMAGDIPELVRRVFGDNLYHCDANSMVLTLTLDDADTVNDYCLNACGGAPRVAYAADTYINCRNPDLYPPEVVAGIRMNGAPPSCLKLKVGARYMIIKNMMKNVFNGVRCQLMAFAGSKCVFVKLLSGPGVGTTILLPACVFTVPPESSGLPFSVRRRQFPLIPAYAVTIHKAQGQTLRTVGLYISREMFTHGLLYTALSRTRGWANIVVHSILPNASAIANCVYQHIFNS
jgi:ATP-dependent DNA helicase PIF1